jgi:hypothetical protein
MGSSVVDATAVPVFWEGYKKTGCTRAMYHRPYAFLADWLICDREVYILKIQKASTNVRNIAPNTNANSFLLAVRAKKKLMAIPQEMISATKRYKIWYLFIFSSFPQLY